VLSGSGEVSMTVVVLVKAAPVLTSKLDETMCVAGVRTDAAAPEWVRLHPVPFRDLDDDSKFAKYQSIDVSVRRDRTDRRPESWTPTYGSIVLGDRLGTDSGWALRRQLVDGLGEANMCDLVEANRAGSGPGTPSLAVVRPVEGPHFKVSKRDEAQIKTWQARAAAVAARQSLFDDGRERKPDFDVVPWRFQYEFRCAAPACKSRHTQTIVDWEAFALWRHVRHDADWIEKMRHKFEDELWDGRDSVLFVGNQNEHPASFLVLGVFWPPEGAVQGVLDL
jgi:hypothetical protein